MKSDVNLPFLTVFLYFSLKYNSSKKYNRKCNLIRKSCFFSTTCYLALAIRMYPPLFSFSFWLAQCTKGASWVIKCPKWIRITLNISFLDIRHFCDAQYWWCSKYVWTSQSKNLRIFLLSRFYVKSIFVKFFVFNAESHQFYVKSEFQKNPYDFHTVWTLLILNILYSYVMYYILVPHRFFRGLFEHQQLINLTEQVAEVSFIGGSVVKVRTVVRLLTSRKKFMWIGVRIQPRPRLHQT